MCDTSMMPLRVAMPNSVMNPMIDATLSTPPARNTPGDAADQRERQVDHDQQRVARAAERQDEQHEQPGDRRAAEHQQPLASRSAGSRTARRTRRGSPSGIGTCCGDRAPGCPPTTLPRSRPRDVARHDDPALHVLAQDHVRRPSRGARRPAPGSAPCRPSACRSAGRRCARSRRLLPDRASRPGRTPWRGRRRVPPTVPAKLVSIASATSWTRRP